MDIDVSRENALDALTDDVKAIMGNRNDIQRLTPELEKH